jgi:imidazolonepropionase
LGDILIRGARQLVTLRGSKSPRRGAELNSLGIIQDGSLLLRNGLIDQVGPTRRVENLTRSRGATEIDASGRVVMPGFVDSHTHLLFPLPGSVAEEHEDAVKHVRACSGHRLQGRARIFLDAMARHGTTTVEAKTGCGPDASAENKLLRVLSALKHDPIDVIPTFLFRQPSGPNHLEAGAAAEWALAELLPKLKRRLTGGFTDVAWDSDPAHHGQFVRVLEGARSLGYACKIHAGQIGSPAAITTAIQQQVVSIDHIERIAAGEAAALAASNTIATLLPCVSFQHGPADSPARALIDAGATVALASNFNPQLTPTLNMQTVVALACLNLGMTAAEAISAATINGAYAAGWGDRVGSLEVGKSADILILDLPDYRELCRHFGMNHVFMTIKRGERIYQQGRVSPQNSRGLQPGE